VEHDHKKACTIRVLVADNSQFHTQLLAGVLSRDPDLLVVTSDLNASSLVAASLTEKIDVFVLSAFVDEGAQRGFESLQDLRETNPNVRAVMLLDSSKPEAVLQAFRAGARGVFDSQESSDMLCQCIRKVHQGQVWVNNDQMAIVVDALASAPRVRAVDGKGLNLLSKREVDVVGCLAEGLTNREIGERLGLSQHTIKNHMFRIFDKLGVSNRIELLFMTLSQSPAAPPLLEALLQDPVGKYDKATLGFCEKAAEHGVLAAQLLLGRISWAARASDSDVKRAYLWFSVALEQLTRTQNNVKKAMNGTQLAEAERKVRQLLNKTQRIETPFSAKISSDSACSIVA
jgi:DNA-binding NarL/FixJ family response regulator